MNKVFVLGSINVDYVVMTDKLPKVGETIFGSDFIKNPGGKGSNQAVAVKNQGVETIFIGCVGNDTDGIEMINNLKYYGIDTKNIKRVNNHTGKAFITLCNSDNSIIVIKGANQNINKTALDKALEEAKPNDFFISQFEVEPNILEYGVTKAKKIGLITVINPSPVKSISDELYSKIDYLILNKDEAEELSGKSFNLNSIEVFKFFKQKNVKNVIITLGSNGVAFVKDNVLHIQNANNVEVLDTTAAGDTFLGSFVSQMILNKSTEEACRYANKAASIACTRLGAQKSIPTKDEIII